MKRTAKILALVLSLVLIFGVVAMVASATPTDATGTKTANFDSAVADTVVGTASDSTNPSVDGVTFQQGGRTGKVVVKKNSVDGNQYVLITQEDQVNNSTSGPYAYITTGGNASVDASTKTLTKGTNDITMHKYLSFSVDVMAPLGKITEGNIDFGGRCFYEGATSRNFWYTDATQYVVRFGNDAGGAYLYSGADSTVKKYINPYEFTNIQVVVENTSTEVEGEVTLGVTSYVYVNGEFWFSKAATTFTTNGSTPVTYYNNEPHAAFVEVRVNYKAGNDNTVSLALDNVQWFTVPVNSETTLDDVLTYDAENRPFGVALAEVDGVKYDNIEKAVEAAPQGGTITLLANVDTPVTVGKIVTINAGEYTADFRAADGFAVDNSVAGVYKIVSSAGQTVEIIFDECWCDDPCDDVSVKHPLYYYIEEAAIYTKILNLYNPTYTGYVGDDGVIYTLKGWKNTDTDEMIDIDTAVTYEDVSAGCIILEPVYEVATVDVTYIKDGKLVYVDTGSGMSLNDVVADADAGSTITLLNDITVTGSVTVNGKAITIDLNGKTIKAMATTATKWSIFLLRSGCDLTVKSSVVGGKIFNNGFSNATSIGAAGVFNTNNDTSKLTLLGKDADGNQSLSIYSGNLIQGYGNAMEYHIDGGIYVCVTGDQQGFIDLRKAGADASIKNAIFYSTHTCVISYAGRNTPTDLDATVTVDNCVFIGNAVASVVYPVVINMTNSYVYGNITAAISGTYKTMAYGSGDLLNQANTPATVVLGEGMYVSGNITENVTYAEGYSLYDVPTTKEFTYYTHKWAYDTTGSAPVYLDDSYVVTTVTEALTFAKQTSDKVLQTITITWKNAAGEVIGTSEALPGTTAAVPAGLKGSPFIEGWLNYVPAEWNESLEIPEDATEYTITEKEGGAYTLSAAPKLLLSYTIQSHFRTNLFVPEVVDGIEITALKMGTTNRNYATAPQMTINGMGYRMVNVWPGMLASANDATASISFTYEGVTYSATATYNSATYVQYVLDTEGYSEDGKALAANLANYIYSGAVAVGSAKADLFATIVENNTSRLIKLTEAEKTTLPDTSAIADAVTGLSLTIPSDGYGPQFVFAIADGANVSITSGTAGEGTITVQKAYFRDINNTKITVTPAEGDPIVVTYTLANYYAQLAAGGASDATLNFVEAMHGVAIADANY